MPPTGSGLRRPYVEPTFGQRVAARFVDGLVLVLPSIVLWLLPLRTVLAVTLWFAYEIGFTARDGRTPGKRLLGTCIETVDGGDIGLRHAVVRAGVLGLGFVMSPALGLVPGFSGAWMLVIALPALAPPLHRGIHDRIAGTRVSAVVARPPGPRC